MNISDEAITDSGGDLLGEIQRRQTYAYIAKERAALAAVSTDEVAWMAFPPTPDDDPADYAPYWIRLSDVTGDRDSKE